MKKLNYVVYTLCVAVVAIIGVLIYFGISESKEIYHFPPRGITLNGVLSADASEMVSKFKSDKKCTDKQTAVWIDLAWINHTLDTIAKEHGDGIRIYFAKCKNINKNTIVIVSTYRAINSDLKAESTQDHVDYYDHTYSSFMSKEDTLSKDSATDPGALLFKPSSPCPAGDCLSVLPNHISCNDAYKAVQNYASPGEINTYSEWFSLKALEAIRNDLDARTKDYPTQPGDGIRIYFAKHTDSTNKKHPGRHAFIIVTTYKVSSGGTDYHYDYFCPSKSFVKVHLDGTDNGEECPNNCNGVTLPQP